MKEKRKYMNLSIGKSEDALSCYIDVSITLAQLRGNGTEDKGISAD